MTDRLAADFTRRAEEQTGVARKFFDAEDFGINPQTQALFVVGKVTANVLHVMADLVAYLKGTADMDEVAVRRKEITERANGIRHAAAAGDWDAFDKIVEELIGGGNAGGNGAE